MVLLPLRGWTGERMAIDMAAQQLLQSVHASAQNLNEAPVASLAPCHGPEQSEPSHGAGEISACESCGACQACHSVALSLGTRWALVLTAARVLPAAASDPFASAEAAPGYKPPIA